MPVKDKRGNADRVYNFEWSTFWGLYDDEPVMLNAGRRRIDAIYKHFAPSRKRPDLKLLHLAPKRVRSMDTAAYYTPDYHRITSTLLVFNEVYLTHETTHSLSERDTWEAHGPEFVRNLIEIHCWRLKMAAAPRVRLAREHWGLRVADAFRLGRDPTRG